jgi:hypothetical protein
MSYVNFNSLIGEVIKEIIGGPDDEELIFITESGRTFKMYHQQDCCEHVYISDIDGNIQGLVGQLITHASEDSGKIPMEYESGTWTFYRIGTPKDFFVIRWNGYSNGYYSESVDFEEIE